METEETNLIKKATPVAATGVSLEISSGDCVSATTIRKLNVHLLVLCAGVAFLAFLDRRNLGFVANDLCNTLQLNHEEYGLGVSLFSVGYIASHIGSNLILKKVGAPIWLSVIVASWGCCAACFAFIQRRVHFYVLRVMLGVAEGGCFPGVVYYLSLFYPDEDITQPLALITASVVFALPISAVIAAGLLKLDGLFGIAGWRYLFIVEGAIPVLFSFLLFWKLPESVESASFLSGDEKKWIREHRMQNQSTEMSVFGEIKQVLRNRAFLWICLATAMFSAVQDMLMYWLTLLIHGMLNGDTDSDAKKTCGSSDKDSTVAIVLTAVPFVFGGILCISLRNFTLFLQNRTLTVGAAKGIAGLFLISWLVTKQVSFALGFMSLILSIGSALFAHSLIHGVVVTLFSHSLRAVATGVFSTSISLGTLTGPLIMGKLIHEYGYSCGILVSGVVTLFASILFGFVKDPLQRQSSPIPLSSFQEQEHEFNE